MEKHSMIIQHIPAILWGRPSEKIYVFIHGKMGSKEDAQIFAELAERKGWQTLSFYLPEHGDRKDFAKLDVWHGVEELRIIADYVSSQWDQLALYACSLGAYFALNTFSDSPFTKCLFQSPIADMQYLVNCMMQWFDVSEERLCREGRVDTPIDPLRWDYYRYIMEHPVEKWSIPTAILYGGKDALQSEEVMSDFARRFSCDLTISPESGHAFMETDGNIIVKKWIWDNL